MEYNFATRIKTLFIILFYSKSVPQIKHCFTFSSVHYCHWSNSEFRVYETTKLRTYTFDKFVNITLIARSIFFVRKLILVIMSLDLLA